MSYHGNKIQHGHLGQRSLFRLTKVRRKRIYVLEDDWELFVRMGLKQRTKIHRNRYVWTVKIYRERITWSEVSYSPDPYFSLHYTGIFWHRSKSLFRKLERDRTNLGFSFVGMKWISSVITVSTVDIIFELRFQFWIRSMFTRRTSIRTYPYSWSIKKSRRKKIST